MPPLTPALLEGLGQNHQLPHSLPHTADGFLQRVPVGLILTFLATKLPYRKGIGVWQASSFVIRDPLIQSPSGPAGSS